MVPEPDTHRLPWHLGADAGVTLLVPNQIAQPGTRPQARKRTCAYNRCVHGHFRLYRARQQQRIAFAERLLHVQGGVHHTGRLYDGVFPGHACLLGRGPAIEPLFAYQGRIIHKTFVCVTPAAARDIRAGPFSACAGEFILPQTAGQIGLIDARPGIPERILLQLIGIDAVIIPVSVDIIPSKVPGISKPLQTVLTISVSIWRLGIPFRCL